MKVLLIGGTGVISTEVCKRAIDLQYEVHIANRGKRKKNINQQAQLIIADVKKNSTKKLKEKLGSDNYDVVVDFLSYDVKQLKKMLTVVNCEQYIFVSSATVYNEHNDGKPYRETDSKGNHGWGYCSKKFSCEQELVKIASQQKIKYTIVRPYVTYNNHRFPYQFSPIEYYTIVDRIIRKRPIAIIENDYTTITDSRDFAIGMVGLFGNPAAFNEDFHITSDNITSWKHVVYLLAEQYRVQPNIVKIKKEVLQDFSNSIIDTSEIIYDKMRNMHFDNSKIKKAVPYFNAQRTIEDSITGIYEYFNSKDKKIINYIWAGCLDRLLKTYIDDYSGDYQFYSFKDRLKYKIGFNPILCRGYLGLKQIKAILRS